jgi:hypothetical protein
MLMGEIQAIFFAAQQLYERSGCCASHAAMHQQAPQRIGRGSQGKRANDTLASVYQHSSDTEVKRVVLQLYLITGDSSKLLEAARQETNPELVKIALQTLGAMSATQDLLTMYRAAGNAQTKSDIINAINALIASGHNGVSPLSEIAQSEQNAELRSKAIRNLAIAGGMSVAPTLVKMYEKNTDPETKRAAAQALFLANDAPDLVTLARSEKDVEMKQYLVQQLSLMHNRDLASSRVTSSSSRDHCPHLTPQWRPRHRTDRL